MMQGMEFYFHRRDQQQDREEHLAREDWRLCDILWSADGSDPLAPIGEVVPPRPPSNLGGHALLPLPPFLIFLPTMYSPRG